MLLRRVWPSRPTYDSPFGDFDQLRRDMMRLVDSLGGNEWYDSGAGVFPPINVTQDEDNFYLRAEVPGTAADNLSVSALRNRVSLSGKREIPKEHAKVSYHRKERAEGAFDRTLVLPSEVDADRVNARYENGVLSVTLPKAEAAKPRRITVKS